MWTWVAVVSIGLWYFIAGLLLDTPNAKSMIVFNIIPMLTGAFLVVVGVTELMKYL